MKSTWLFILMVMLTVQSLGLSNAAALYESHELPATMDMHSGHSDMHEGSSDMPCCPDDMSANMVDCCSELECGCCWGCSGLMSVPLKLSTSLHGLDHPNITNTLQIVSISLKSLYRPPISA